MGLLTYLLSPPDPPSSPVPLGGFVLVGPFLHKVQGLGLRVEDLGLTVFFIGPFLQRLIASRDA